MNARDCSRPIALSALTVLATMVASVTLADDPILILGPAQAHHTGAASSWAGYFLSALGGGTLLGALRPTRDISAWGASRTSRRAASSLRPSCWSISMRRG